MVAAEPYNHRRTRNVSWFKKVPDSYNYQNGRKYNDHNSDDDDNDIIVQNNQEQTNDHQIIVPRRNAPRNRIIPARYR